MKINLGCGRNYKDGWINCDISKDVKTDKRFDILNGLPFDDNSVDEIYASGVFEQILANKDFMNVMNECWQVLKENGKLTIVVPSAKHGNAFKDPHDCRQFTEETFEYFIEGNGEYNLYGKVYGYLPWKKESLTISEGGIITAILIK